MKGIRFGALHSDDLGLILGKKEIGAPAVKDEKTDIPGGDGSLDQTEFFGEPKFENRTHRFDFSTMAPAEEFPTVYSNVLNRLHGRKMRIILDDDPLYFYLGRLHVSPFTSEKGVGMINVEADCEPYKYKKDHTVIAQSISGTQAIILTNGRKRAVPEVQVYTQSGSIQIEFQGNVWNLSSGSYTLPELELIEGENVVNVAGTGTVTFSWQEGDL
jgi:phage-related protein